MGTGYGEFLYLPPSLDEIDAGDITTVAGIGSFSGEGQSATEAQLGSVSDFALSDDGSIFLTQPEEMKIMRIRPDGILEKYAGSLAFTDPTPDGLPALETQLSQARGIAIDKDGNLIFADAFSHRIRRIDALTGIVTTVAGTGIEGYFGDGGPAVSARLCRPNYPVIDEIGSIYFLDFCNYRIRRISPDGKIVTIAGNGTPGYSGDGGQAIEAQFDTSFIDAGGLALDPQGDLYLADTANNAIRKIDMQTGIITTLVSNVQEVRAISFDQAGDLYYSGEDSESSRIIQIRNGEVFRTFGEGFGFSEDGTPADQARMSSIDRIRIDSQGNILFTEYVGRLRRINLTTGLLETVAGIGPRVIGENGPGLAMRMQLHFSDLEFLPNGDLLIVDGDYQRIWKMDAEGNISGYIGTGLPFIDERVNAPITETTICAPLAIELRENGTLYVLGADVIRKIDENGIVRLVAGMFGTADFGPDFAGDGGPATEAELLQPWDFTLDPEGNIYIADTNNNRIRRVDAATGIITTVAGSGPSNGFEGYGNGSFCGDNGPALAACLNTPRGVILDSEGNLYIADSGNGRIRKVDRNGIITTFAYVVNNPTKMIFDGEGNLYTIAACKVLQISPLGQVTVLAGTPGCGFSGDGGLATEAQLIDSGQAAGLAIDAQGNLFFVDSLNPRVRVIKQAAPPAP